MADFFQGGQKICRAPLRLFLCHRVDRKKQMYYNTNYGGGYMAEEKKSMHSGHRERMRQRFLKDPKLSGFAEHEIMEILLFSIFPRGDTNAIAHRLIDGFGTVRQVVSAPAERIAQIGGISESSAVMLKMMGAVSDHIGRQEFDLVDVRDKEKFENYLITLLRHEPVEHFIMMVVTPDMRVGMTAQVSQGNTTSTSVNFRELAKLALNASADSIIVAHNHPDSSCKPSKDDIILTRKMMQYLAPFNISVLDHFVVGRDGVFSLRKNVLIFDTEC